MQYAIDMSNMTLLELVDLRKQILIGTIEIDDQSLTLLLEYAQGRIGIVETLERCLSH